MYIYIYIELREEFDGQTAHTFFNPDTANPKCASNKVEVATIWPFQTSRAMACCNIEEEAEKEEEEEDEEEEEEEEEEGEEEEEEAEAEEEEEDDENEYAYEHEEDENKEEE